LKLTILHKLTIYRIVVEEILRNDVLYEIVNFSITTEELVKYNFTIMNFQASDWISILIRNILTQEKINKISFEQ